MAQIRVLPDIVANRIAAGEVVERPESVVKELLENALDAGASDIRILLKDGGKNGIVVIDNGCGMAYDDAMLAFERHATSKIHDEKDLQHVQTLGFRGEALPSIASVSRLTLHTCESGESEGTIIQLNGGVMKQVTRAPMDPGTKIEVNALFRNVPARRRFLRTPETEYGRVARMITAYALANPDVALSLTHNGKQTIRFDGRQNLENRVREILGTDVANAHQSFNWGDVSVFLLPPEHNLKSPMKQYFLLNGRAIRDRTISAAMMSAYRATAAHIEGSPQVVIRLRVDPQQVDVNVHPSKLEVRFRNQSEVYNGVRNTCMEALAARTRTPGAFYHAGRERLDTRVPHQVREHVWPSSQTVPVDQAHEVPAGRLENSYSLHHRSTAEERPRMERVTDVPVVEGSFHVLAQFQETYILVEREGDLYIVDQHVAHERILFEQALQVIRDDRLETSRLLVPETVNLDPQYRSVVEQDQQTLHQAGFTAELVEDGTALITSCPVFVPNGETQRTFLELLALLEEQRDADRGELYRDVAALIGCKAAIKANHPLSHAEMTRLIRDLFETDNPFYCPHGRPVIIRLTLPEIEKLFKRS